MKSHGKSAGTGRVPRAAIALVFLAAFASGLAAQTAPGTPAATPAAATPSAVAEGTTDTITFSARRVESVLAKGKEKTILTGSARVLTGSMEIKAERIELTGTDYTHVVCTGVVTVNDEKEGFLIKCASLVYDRDTEIGLAEGAVTLDDSKNKVLLDAQWVKFDQKQSLVEARTGVHILKEDFAVRSEFALFNRKDETLQLTGAPAAANADGLVQADKIAGTADANSLEFSGQVNGTITTKKKEGTAP